LGNRLFHSKFSIVVGLIVEMIAFSILSPVFMSSGNLIDICLQSSIAALVAVGMTFVIGVGGIDLSVGSIAALSGIVTAMVLKKNAAVLIACVCGMGAGMVCGLGNGALIACSSLNPFMTTFGMMSILRGLALILTQGRAVYGFAPAFRYVGTGLLGVLPVPVVFAAVVALLGELMLRKSVLGRYTLAIGDNEEACRLSGVRVKRYKLTIYVMSGLLASLAGIVLTARVNAAEPLAGSGYELDAIAAVVLGGSRFSGGEASVMGTILGVLFLGVLRNGLTLLNIHSYTQQIVIGAVVILAVLADRSRQAK